MRIALRRRRPATLSLDRAHDRRRVDRYRAIADSFPVERQNTIRQELAMALAAVMTQSLLPKAGGGLSPARSCWSELRRAAAHRKNALQHLHQEITITRKDGSFTFEESCGATGQAQVSSASGRPRRACIGESWRAS
jgi:Tfp pilus assembly pilus retraction ATPase PilT